eukprot:TRINITY_DN1468_c0_g1_i1.p1 TRINITY_DN1468_c0_g1~~TRINITY_DN1468_c0_g1_i1.p1  ORF type:complete len:255 (-),score=30.46 TRINITY_DN1468_c0_g1_i1:471-1235(-)
MDRRWWTSWDFRCYKYNPSQTAFVVERCTQAGVRLLFIESICNDPKIIDENLKMKISRSPDYSMFRQRRLLKDIKQRIKNYESVYETLVDEEGLSYIKIINMSSKLEACNVTGVIPRLLIIFVMNLHADQKRKIWICRAGNTTHDPVGDGSAVPYKTEHCALSSSGLKFSQNLAAFVKAQKIEGEYQVWTSTLNRAVKTIGFIAKTRNTFNLWRLENGTPGRLLRDVAESNTKQISGIVQKLAGRSISLSIFWW